MTAPDDAARRPSTHPTAQPASGADSRPESRPASRTDSRPASAPHATSLDQVARGYSATIAELRQPDGQAMADHIERLMELGFLPGETVRVLAKGVPSGEPIAVRVGQATFALRRFEAEWIRVRTPHRTGT